MEHDFLVISVENLQEQWNVWKGSLFSRWEYGKRKFVFHLFKAIFGTSFSPSWPFFSALRAEVFLLYGF